MKPVRFTEDSGECCGKILNEAAVIDRLHCGMKSIHGTEESPLYYQCWDCHLKSLYPEGIQTKRG